MERRLYHSEFMSQKDIYNINNKDFKGRLFIYNHFPNELRNKGNNLFYYNEEDNNKNPQNILKNFKSRNQNKNNLLFANICKTKEETENKIMIKKNNLFNFVAKEDKNKNLKVKGINNKEEMDLYLKMDNDKMKKKFIFNNNRNISANIFSKFNFNNLININTNAIKIISQVVAVFPRTQVCYFTREYKSYKPSKIPSQKICYYKKSYIYKDNQIKIPKTEICYFNKLFINFQQNYKCSVINKGYFCTKIKKSKKNKRKKKSKEQKKLKHKSMIEMKNSKKNTRFSATIGRNRKNSPTKESTKINFFRNPFTNSKLKNFQTFNQEDNLNNDINKDNSLPKNINLHKSKPKARTKSKSPRNKKSEKYTQLPNLPNLINGQREVTSTSSSNERGRKHSSLFQHFLKKKEKSNKVIGLRKSKNKVVLHKYIPNGYEKNGNNDKIIMPKIKDSSSINTTHKTPKTKINTNVLSSNDLINKINVDASYDKNLNRNKNNQLLNNKKQYSFDHSNYNIMNYKHKEVENNSIKNSVHYNLNNLPSPKYHRDKQKNSLIDESKLEKVPKINSHLLKKNMELKPLTNNENNKTDKINIFEGFKRKNKSISLKKINFSSKKNDMYKNYKSGFLAIKEYFNIK